jgi:phosphatidylserine/phosphatidylglycerophosphate/cardiolipin synthase-like enzyme
VQKLTVRLDFIPELSDLLHSSLPVHCTYWDYLKMSKIKIGSENPRVKLVPDADYYKVVRSLIQNATDRILCNLFIVDINPAREIDLLVNQVFLDLQEANWRGLDARLLIGGSRTNYEIARLSDAARERAHLLGLKCKWLTSRPIRGSHTKIVIADESVLTGSHNWSAGAFSSQTQDSILVRSKPLSSFLAAKFNYHWTEATEVVGNV